ncbi:MAG: APC family permease [Proteobacteria bacterium]|nr:APC family permease [Pseudomonadota bacterium]
MAAMAPDALNQPLPRAGDPAAGECLRRSLTFWPLLFYGLGVIVGAGIYVAIGVVISRAGGGAPLSFLLAGLIAGLTGLCYAELASRFPHAGGAAIYVERGFCSVRAGQLLGALMTVALAVSAASIARGAVNYLEMLLPVATPVLITALIIVFTAVATWGVRESVGLAAAIGAMEIGGLALTVAVALLDTTTFDVAGLLPTTLRAWHGVAAGGFIAFFAFIGFETLANLAEEAKDARRTVPRGMLSAIAASMVLYIAVATVAVLGYRSEPNPLVAVFAGRGAMAFAVLGFLAVANGVLIHIVMLARLFYGMARSGQLPAVLGTVHPRTRTPVRATILVGTIVLATALLVPFERLLVLADGLTLAAFALVDVALWRVHRQEPATAGVFAIPHWIPPLAALSAVGLILAELVG